MPKEKSPLLLTYYTTFYVAFQAPARIPPQLRTFPSGIALPASPKPGGARGVLLFSSSASSMPSPHPQSPVGADLRPAPRFVQIPAFPAQRRKRRPRCPLSALKRDEWKRSGSINLRADDLYYKDNAQARFQVRSVTVPHRLWPRRKTRTFRRARAARAPRTQSAR